MSFKMKKFKTILFLIISLVTVLFIGCVKNQTGAIEKHEEKTISLKSTELLDEKERKINLLQNETKDERIEGYVLEKCWQYNPAFSSYARPIIDDKSIYVSTTGGLCSLDRQSGGQNWYTEMEGPIPPMYMDDDILVFGGPGNPGGYVRVIAKKTGEILWKNKVFRYLWTKPVADDKNIYLLPEESRPKAYDKATGKEVWKFMPKDGGNIMAHGNVSLIEDTLYFSDGETFYAVDKQTGKEKWQISDIDIGYGGSIHTARGKIYISGVNSDKSTIYAIDPLEKKIEWKKDFDIQIASHLICKNEKIYFYAHKAMDYKSYYIYRLDANTGEVNMQFKSETKLHDMQLYNDLLFFTTDDSISSIALDGSNHKENKVDFLIAGRFSVLDSELYLTSKKGILYKYKFGFSKQ